jgi:hypothetical protein
MVYIMHGLDSIFTSYSTYRAGKCSNITEIHGIRVLVFADAPILHHLVNWVHMQWKMYLLTGFLNLFFIFENFFGEIQKYSTVLYLSTLHFFRLYVY